MKKPYILPLFAVFTLATAFMGYTKFESSPSLSPASIKERLVNTWKIETISKNGDNFTSL